MKEFIDFAGVTTLVVRLLPNLIIAPALLKEFTPAWSTYARAVAESFPHIPWMITSIVSSKDGAPREVGGSHIQGWSMDMAPLYSSNRALRPDMASPRLSDNRQWLASIADWVDKVNIPIAIVSEGDHLHLDRSFPKGAYAYSSYRGVYTNDHKGMCQHVSPLTGNLCLATPTGEIRGADVPRSTNPPPLQPLNGWEPIIIPALDMIQGPLTAVLQRRRSKQVRAESEKQTPSFYDGFIDPN